MMTANKNYWGGAPKIDEVDFVYYQNADTMVQEMKSGSLQGAWGVLEPSTASSRTTPPSSPSPARPRARRARLQLLHGPFAGQPRAQGLALPQALQWAVDHNKIVQIAYGGLAQPADSVLVSHLWSDPDWHWQPPADETYDFDLAKAGQMLTAAGYPLKNGVRLDKQGKPIVLRLWTRSRAPTRASRPAS